MADHCGPALESCAAGALAAVGCVAARDRSRACRYPTDPCGHPAYEELMRDAKLLRLRAAKQSVRGTEASEKQRGSRAGDERGDWAG